MDELAVGDPALLATDVGPVIDDDALAMLDAPCASDARGARAGIHRAPARAERARGTFVAPLAVEIDSLGALQREVFGPVAARRALSRRRDLDALVDAINATGYGLTLGIHTRIDATAQRIAARAARRQRLRQPQHDRRRGRRAAFRRRGAVRHRARRRAARTTCIASPPSGPSPPTPRPSAATRGCCRWRRAERRRRAALTRARRPALRKLCTASRARRHIDSALP